MVHPHQLVRPCLKKSDLASIAVELRPVAITPRLPGQDADLRRRVQLADPAEYLARDLRFARRLEFGAGVLIVAFRRNG